MLSELTFKETVAEPRENSDQLAMMPETIFKMTSKRLSDMLGEILAWQMRKCKS